MTKTKIICTIGPASRSPEVLEKLVEAGMNVARLNFSHGTLEQHAQTIRDIRAVAAKLNRHVAFSCRTCRGPRSAPGRWPPAPSRCGTGSRSR